MQKLRNVDGARSAVFGAGLSILLRDIRRGSREVSLLIPESNTEHYSPKMVGEALTFMYADDVEIIITKPSLLRT